jgi:hypothetical protein
LSIAERVSALVEASKPPAAEANPDQEEGATMAPLGCSRRWANGTLMARSDNGTLPHDPGRVPLLPLVVLERATGIEPA